MGRRSTAVGLAVALVAALAGACSIDLGDLGGASATAYDINEAGVIVGVSGIPGGGSHAFRRLPDATMIDLGTLPGGNGSAAFAVNESGQVAGTATTPTTDPARPDAHAVRWDTDGTIHDLGVIGSGSGGTVIGIDEGGRIVGQRASSTGNHAFVFDPAVGHLVDLADLPGATISLVYGMNDVGDAVGYQDIPPNRYVTPVRWDLDAGTVTDLSPVWGGSALPTDINEAGAMVGLLQVGGPGIQNIRAAIVPPGATSPLLLGLQETSSPTEINDSGVVVGYHGTGATRVAFRWDATSGPVDLEGDEPAGDTSAYSINDRGQIVGADGPRAVLLFPTPP